MAIKRIPEFRKESNRWVAIGFDAPQAAFDWPRLRGSVGYLYAFGCEGHIKLGKSQNPERRLEQLSTAAPQPITKLLIRRVPACSLAYTEAWLHQRFADYRVHGEWFSVSEQEVRAAMPKAQKYAQLFERECMKWWEGVTRVEINGPSLLGATQ